jgi:hypothetical protein
MLLLKTPPMIPESRSPQDFQLGEPSDGLLLVEAAPTAIHMGLYAEFVHLPLVRAKPWSIELFATDRRATHERLWYLDEQHVAASVPADDDWDDLIVHPLLFDIVLEDVPETDMDLLLVIAIDGEPVALKPLYLRREVPAMPEGDA